MKIEGGTNASENFRVVRLETDGAETQLSPTAMPTDAINALGSIANCQGNSDFLRDMPKQTKCLIQSSGLNDLDSSTST